MVDGVREATALELITYLKINVTRRDGTFGYVTRPHASHVVTYKRMHTDVARVV